jgi:hypothetical protein
VCIPINLGQHRSPHHLIAAEHLGQGDKLHGTVNRGHKVDEAGCLADADMALLAVVDPFAAGLKLAVLDEAQPFLLDLLDLDDASH